MGNSLGSIGPMMANRKLIFGSGRIFVSSKRPFFPAVIGNVFLHQERSNPHEFVQLRRGQAPIEETELSFVSYFVCSIQKSSHCRAI